MSFDHEHDDMVRSVLRRAAILKVDDSGTQQKLDLSGLKNEKPKKIVRILPHGFNSNPPKDSEGIILQLGGRSDRSMFFGGEHKDKRQKNLKEGQAVLYDSEGNVVFVKTTDGISVNAKKGKIEIHAQNDLVAVISDTGKVYVKPGGGQFVYLGGDGADGSYGFVETDIGTSTNVKAKV